MSSEYPVIDQFLQDWIEEFSRAVEMFASEAANVQCTAATSRYRETPGDYLWWKQSFSGTGNFTTWIGAAEAAWSPLGGAMASPGDDPKQLFFEMLGQAQQGAATLLTSRTGQQTQCQDGIASEPETLNSLIVAEIKIVFKGVTLPSLLYAFDLSAPDVMGAPNVPEKFGNPDPDNVEQAYGPMLHRIMDLELPLSVALGRAILPIQEILKLTSGSLIELDRHVGESVELMIHGTIVAKGEVVSVKGNYAIRIKEIISRTDRMALPHR